MKTYKEFDSICIGASDMASLVIVGYKEGIGAVPQMLDFGEDGSYRAYIITEEDVIIGEHYKKVAEYSKWMRIYDDEELSGSFIGNNIEVYRAGMYGCIIKIVD